MLDALLPSLDALRSTIADAAGKTDMEAFEAATCAAEKGLLTTILYPNNNNRPIKYIGVPLHCTLI